MFRDTSMDYLSRDEVLEIWNNNMRLTDEQLLAMDETEFRARVRERSHHTLEIQVYATAYRHQKLKPNQADYTKHLLELWEKRGLGKNSAGISVCLFPDRCGGETGKGGKTWI